LPWFRCKGGAVTFLGRLKTNVNANFLIWQETLTKTSSRIKENSAYRSLPSLSSQLCCELVENPFSINFEIKQLGLMLNKPIPKPFLAFALIHDGM